MTNGTAPRYVVDTNVPLVANGMSTAGPDCVISCTRAVRDVVESGHVVVDDCWRIVEEYKHQLSPTGQPGPGDAFLKWLLSNLWNAARCTQVALTPLDDHAGDFEEFPPALRSIGFDHSEPKFVAVATG